MPQYHSYLRIAFAAFALCAVAMPAHARTLLKNICRVKGQEENTIQGMGLVIGLAGTGDGANFLPTVRGLATMLERMNNPIGQKGPIELKDAKNVALVMVTATVPAAGARQGDVIECTVSSIGSSKSLEKGVLLTTPLLGPQVGILEDQRVYGFAQGPIQLEDAKIKTTGKVSRGCRLEEDFNNPFFENGKFTLVLNRSHADFQVARDVAELIDSQFGFHFGLQRFSSGDRSTTPDQLAPRATEPQQGRSMADHVPLARAVDSVNIEVTIPSQFHDDPVAFVADVLSLPVSEPQTASPVVINERTGTIVFSGDIEISPVGVTHKNMVVEAGQTQPANRFVAVDTAAKPTAKLKNLVDALEALKVPPEDKIAIIKEIARAGKLHAKLVIE
jgi:flagellar P-ring protein precursor FlgI